MEVIRRMENFDNKVTQPIQHYFDVIEQLLEELYYIENVLDILNIGFARQSAQDWAESTTHILTSYIRQIRLEYEKEFRTDDTTE